MRRNKLVLIVMLVLLLVLSGTSLAYAQDIGVGINIGKISVDEPMMPGGSYGLPSINIINTGEVTSNYEIGVSYHRNQPEMRPPAEWFEFDPATVTLEPGQSAPIAITLDLPLKAKSGDYFAYLEAHPLAKEGEVAIGIAAAAKLYFTIKPANIFSAFANQVSEFFTDYSPYTWVVLGVVVLIIIFFLIRRFVHISFRVEKRE